MSTKQRIADAIGMRFAKPGEKAGWTVQCYSKAILKREFHVTEEAAVKAARRLVVFRFTNRAIVIAPATLKRRPRAFGAPLSASGPYDAGT